MIPISDTQTIGRGRPVVNIALIAINAVVFFYELSLAGLDREIFFFSYGLIPIELSEGISFTNLGGPTGPEISSPLPTWGTVFSSMFIHGGFVHFIGNMLFLWVFGDNVEDRLGHVKYLIFYLGTGVAAALAQVAVDLDSKTPLIGASGAISGVLGAYFLLYPYNRITTLVFFFFIMVIRVPAVFFLGIYFIMQLFNGLGSLGPSASGGVAYMAHVGGFAAGVMLMAGYKLLLRERIWPRRRSRPRRY